MNDTYNFEIDLHKPCDLGDLKNLNNKKNIKHDPFIKEFFAFCKINGVEKEAARLIGEKIKEKKMPRA